MMNTLLLLGSFRFAPDRMDGQSLDLIFRHQPDIWGLTKGMLQSIYILILKTIPFLVQQNVGLVLGLSGAGGPNRSGWTFPRPVSHIQCFFILVFTIPSYCRRRQRSRIFSCHRHSSLAAAVLNYYPPPSLVASVLSITAAKSPPSPLSNATNFVSFRPITHQRHE